MDRQRGALRYPRLGTRRDTGGDKRLGAGHLLCRWPVPDILFGLDRWLDAIGHRFRDDPYARSQFTALQVDRPRPRRRNSSRHRLQCDRFELRPRRERRGLAGVRQLLGRPQADQARQENRQARAWRYAHVVASLSSRARGCGQSDRGRLHLPARRLLLSLRQLRLLLPQARLQLFRRLWSFEEHHRPLCRQGGQADDGRRRQDGADRAALGRHALARPRPLRPVPRQGSRHHRLPRLRCRT